MDILEILKDDHDKVKKMLKTMHKSNGESKKEELENLKSEIIPHMVGEESLFYPLFTENDDTKEIGFEAFEEHEIARKALAVLEGTDPEDERWSARLKVLRELIEHHIEEEEGEIFKKSSELLSSEEKEKLGQDFKDLKEKMLH